MTLSGSAITRKISLSWPRPRSRATSAFLPWGERDLEEIFACALGSVENAVEARRSETAEAIRQVVKYEDQVDSLEEDLRDKHIARLANNECRASHGVIFLTSSETWSGFPTTP